VYGVALSASACLRAGTRVDVAWIVDAPSYAGLDATEAVALTPGGGRIGSLLSGALDGALADQVSRQIDHGRLVQVEISEVDALVAGLPAPGTVQCVIVPATALPDELWPALRERRPVCLVGHVDSRTGDIPTIDVYTAETIADAEPDVAELFAGGRSVSVLGEERVVTVLSPVPRLVVAGSGPVADALVAAGSVLDWRIEVAADPDTAVAAATGLSALDGIVVMGHEVEAAGRILAAALQSGAGYIGGLGSMTMQGKRADWLAYRGITDLDRIHGPAGIDIGARSPGEIAISVLAEAIASRGATASRPPPGEVGSR